MTTFIQTLLAIVSYVIKYASDRQLISAGQAEELARTLNGSLDMLAKIEEAGRNAGNEFDRHSGRLPDDPNRRD